MTIAHIENVLSRDANAAGSMATFFVDGERLDRGWGAFTLMAAIRGRPHAGQDHPHAR